MKTFKKNNDHMLLKEWVAFKNKIQKIVRETETPQKIQTSFITLSLLAQRTINQYYS